MPLADPLPSHRHIYFILFYFIYLFPDRIDYHHKIHNSKKTDDAT